MAKRGYEQVVEGEWYEPTLKGHVEQCCDCQLVHKNEYRVLNPEGDVVTGMRVEMRCWRDERKTAAARRTKKARLIGLLRELVDLA